ncbi:MAG: dihydroorotate dehydrogenase electron transfer subunit [Nitrospirae bacterium]|nr:dihydroorotate dehydrogenase electron transfer subunit [Nitrospirota bacterium]
MSRYFRAKVVSNLPLNKKSNLLTLRPLERAKNPEPGQFYMIEVGNSYDPLLKRPFSYFRKTSEDIQFLYAVRGKGTLLMKDFMEGEIINIIGPLGTGYPKPSRGYIAVLIGGGTGIASIFSLAERLTKNAYILHGAKCREELLAVNELKSLKGESFICTDDGSFGEKGTTVEILEEILTQNSRLKTQNLIYACGPRAMLEAVSKLAADKGIKGYFSLVEYMACGFGACLGCAVKTVHGYKRVCKEGPVFPIEEIVW